MTEGADLGDTIVARATASGRGAIAVVRLSGPSAAPILRSLVGEDGLPPPRVASLRTLREPGTTRILDQALVTWFPGPASYSGEDLVEISTHGGGLASALVTEACQALGARSAGPGEFTWRAYLNGKLDLVQAEAVQDLVEGRSRAAHGAAVHQLEGGLSRRIAGLREGILEVEVRVAHHVDFPDEDDPPTSLEEVLGSARELEAALRELLALAPVGALLREGALVVLAGRPNAGKSSLFNALLGEERAIVTEEAGTTRDAVEATVSVKGFPFRLVDTAGLREAPGKVERMGVEVARRYLRRAQLVLFCHPVDLPWGEAEAGFLEEMDGRPTMLVQTCVDRVGGREAGPAVPGWAAARGAEARSVSARTGEGLAELRESLARRVFGGLLEAGEDQVVVTRERQRRQLGRAAVEVGAFVAAVEGGVPVDVASGHLREAGVALEELVGVIEPEAVLERLFASFCIGK